jgi:hypothetical protein
MKIKARGLTKRNVNVIGVLGVLVVALVTIYFVAPGTVIGKATFRAGLVSPPPVDEGTLRPENGVYLLINYTGAGYGNYTFVVTYYASGMQHTFSQNVRVSHISPFTYYLYLQSPINSTYPVEIEVYKGATLQQSALAYRAVIT